jgi:hypothetical protein
MTSYDVIVIGTGFGSSFYLHKYLGMAGASTKVLVQQF